jgi:uncharacterized protein
VVVRVAVIGSGISGLASAYLLSRRHEVTLFEAEGRAGGHANTAYVTEGSLTLPVDTGFLVYNERTYPLFIRLLDELGVATQPAEMTFSMSDNQSGVQWRGTSLATVFAQPRNALRPRFAGMLVDIARFNTLARTALATPLDDQVTLGELLEERRFSRAFFDWYLVPLGSSIWSANPSTFTGIPAMAFIRFFERHGLLGRARDLAWRTVTGGSARYVEAVTAVIERRGRLRLHEKVRAIRPGGGGVEVELAGGTEHFDQAVVATHSDEALRLLDQASATERTVLGAIRYQPNRAVLHRDESLLPSARRARASWNYHRLDPPGELPTLTYDITRLQSLPTARPLLVTLNRSDAIDPGLVIASYDYAHPVIDRAAVSAQARRDEINGWQGIWFVGAYWGYGFHEDGVRSALDVALQLGAAW